MDMFWHCRSQFYQYEWGKAREIEPLHVHVRVTPQVSELYLGAIISAWDATRLGHNSTVQTQAWGSYSYCIINVLLLFFLFSQVSSSFFSRWLSFYFYFILLSTYFIIQHQRSVSLIIVVVFCSRTKPWRPTRSPNRLHTIWRRGFPR